MKKDANLISIRQRVYYKTHYNELSFSKIFFSLLFLVGSVAKTGKSNFVIQNFFLCVIVPVNSGKNDECSQFLGRYAPATLSKGQGTVRASNAILLDMRTLLEFI